MSTKDILWSELNSKYKGSESNDCSYLPNRSTIIKALGFVALLVCVLALYDKYNQYTENGEDLYSMLGDTSTNSIVKSSLFTFIFVMSLKLFSERVVELSTDVKSKIEDNTPISNLPIPTDSMPLIVALLVAEASELVSEPYFSEDTGSFDLGHITGILTATVLSSLLGL